MTKKDYVLIANTLREVRTEMSGHALTYKAYRAIVEHFAETLKATNPRFDSILFEQACY